MRIKDLERNKRHLFWLCWLVYFATYLGRLGYAATLGEMIRTEGFSKAEAGFIGTVFFISYGIGQLITGFVGDKASPRTMIFLGTFISALCNFGMTMVKGSILMSIIWCANGVVQSFVWSPIVRLLSTHFDTQEKSRVMVFINSSGPMGTLVTYALSALFVMLFHNWRYFFWLSAILLGGISFVWLSATGKLIKELPSYVNRREEKEKRGKRSFVKGGLIFIAAALFIQGMLKDGITTWVPTFLTEVFSLASAVSIITTAGIPLCNLLGIYMVVWLRKRIPNELTASGVLFFYTAILCALMVAVGSLHAMLSIVLFALITTFMMSINTLLVSIVPGYFAIEGRASSMSGFLNSMAYAGSASSSYSFGAIAGGYGWNAVMLFWFILSLVGWGMTFLGKKNWAKTKEGILKKEAA
ncbi:MAG: MFS transporter [Christensenellaceae bacterium]|jgi:OPA family glycerol-3-phosphate transporter-like MFS transporter